MRRQNSPSSSSRCASVAGSTGGFNAAGAGGVRTTVASLLSGAMLPFQRTTSIALRQRTHQQRQLGAGAQRRHKPAPAVRRGPRPAAVGGLVGEAEHRHVVVRFADGALLTRWPPSRPAREPRAPSAQRQQEVVALLDQLPPASAAITARRATAARRPIAPGQRGAGPAQVDGPLARPHRAEGGEGQRRATPAPAAAGARRARAPPTGAATPAASRCRRCVASDAQLSNGMPQRVGRQLEQQRARRRQRPRCRELRQRAKAREIARATGRSLQPQREAIGAALDDQRRVRAALQARVEPP